MQPTPLSYVNNYSVTPGGTFTVVVGAGGNLYAANSTVAATAGKGAVRIIWGNGRSFPSTAVTLYNQTLI